MFTKSNRVSLPRGQVAYDSVFCGIQTTERSKALRELELYLKKICSDCSIVMCIRMTWSMPAAVPQMMLCLIKFMKHTVICYLSPWQRYSVWLGKHTLFLSCRYCITDTWYSLSLTVKINVIVHCLVQRQICVLFSILFVQFTLFYCRG